MYQLKTCFITTKQTLIQDVTKEWNMEWLTERIKIGSKGNLLMFSFNLHIVLF